MRDELRRLGRAKAPASLAESLFEKAAEIETDAGPTFVVWNRRGVSAVRWATSRTEFERWFAASYRRPLRWVAERPDLSRFDLSRLTPFQRLVLQKTREIPRGEVRTYAWVAREIGHPRAIRAVGSALAINPVPLFIPCHRVVRSDGVIGNYGMGGPVEKRRLLTLEGVAV
ncbi:MAG TPA: MGMT family protein [Candidatus Acidoferrales bacterium]|nr:MGMT family protein [Candidatus Acidoferrales bacterium]